MKKIKLFAVIALTIASVTALASCGGGADTASDTAADTAADTTAENAVYRTIDEIKARPRNVSSTRRTSRTEPSDVPPASVTVSVLPRWS